MMLILAVLAVGCLISIAISMRELANNLEVRVDLARLNLDHDLGAGDRDLK
jgi:hypothetical protein